jgi:hypothetical protein
MEMEPLFDLSKYQKQPEPSELDMLTVYLGAEDAQLLVDTLGGISISIPRVPSGETYNLLISSVGAEVTAKLIERFGGEDLYITSRHREQMTERNTKIRARYQELLKQRKPVQRAIQTCALEFELSDRHIYRIVKDA